jgi:hypothetical protein
MVVVGTHNYASLRQIKRIGRLAVITIAGIILLTALPSCKAAKCDCPTFGGHKLNHS